MSDCGELWLVQMMVCLILIADGGRAVGVTAWSAEHLLAQTCRLLCSSGCCAGASVAGRCLLPSPAAVAAWGGCVGSGILPIRGAVIT
jgi:hypothetical protein